MKTILYKLEEYKIIEHDTGELSWESHFGLGELQEGRCHQKGTILFIGPPENTRLGYLKLEYLDHLKKLPVWKKTEYYCTSLEIYHCNTGKRVSEEEMTLWRFNPTMSGENLQVKTNQDELGELSFTKASNDSAYKLNRFEIIKKTDGHVFWTSYAGQTTRQSGTCTILEDILFIGASEEVQQHVDKRDFLSDLNHLRKWDQTKYYCLKYILHSCKSKSWTHEGKENHPSYNMATKKESDAGQAAVSVNDLPPAASGNKKWIPVAAGFLLLSVLMSLLFLAGQYGTWDDRQKGHASKHRMNR